LKICGDEHFSPWIIKVIQDSCLDKSHQLHHVDDFQAKSVADDIWVKKFAKAGGEVVLGADGMMLRRPTEVVAICDTAMRLIVLPHQWANAPRHLQVSHVLYWWPHIEAVLAASRPRQCFKVPWGWGETKGAVQAIKVDFEGARKKLKKSLRRAG